MGDEIKKVEAAVVTDANDVKAVASKVIDEVVAGIKAADSVAVADTKKVEEVAKVVKTDADKIEEDLQKNVAFVKKQWGWIGPIVGFVVGFVAGLILLGK